MSDEANLAASSLSPRDIHPLLTAPGAAFEVVTEDVLGVPLSVFKDRERSLHPALERSRSFGDRECLVAGDTRLTYAEHADAVASLAICLRDDYGIGKGDHVAIFAANCIEWVISFWAATTLGAVTLTLNSLWSNREAEFGLTHSQPNIIIADSKRRELIPAGIDVPILSVEDDIWPLARRHRGVEFPFAEVDEDDPVVMMYTSGTTGFPKAVMHSIRNVITAVDFMRFNDATVQQMGAPDFGVRRFLLITPLFHISGLHNLIVPRLVLGDTSYIYEGRFDIDRILSLVEKEKITNWIGSPTTLSRLAQAERLAEYDLSSLQAIAVGAAATPPALVEQVSELLPILKTSLATTYGQTETSTAATFALPSERAEFPDSVGLPAANIELEIRDENNQRVPDGVEGEICIRGPQVMLGYWDNDEANERAFSEGRWLHTGDIGVFEDGFLRMTTRRSDLILRGGENVLPMEVESALAEHPDILECGVVGTPHPDLGEEVAASVVHAPSVSLTAQELEKFLSHRLARYKIPTRWKIGTTPLPRNASEKVQRNKLFGTSA